MGEKLELPLERFSVETQRFFLGFSCFQHGRMWRCQDPRNGTALVGGKAGKIGNFHLERRFGMAWKNSREDEETICRDGGIGQGGMDSEINGASSIVRSLFKDQLGWGA